MNDKPQLSTLPNEIRILTNDNVFLGASLHQLRHNSRVFIDMLDSGQTKPPDSSSSTPYLRLSGNSSLWRWLLDTIHLENERPEALDSPMPEVTSGSKKWDSKKFDDLCYGLVIASRYQIAKAQIRLADELVKLLSASPVYWRTTYTIAERIGFTQLQQHANAVGANYLYSRRKNDQNELEKTIMSKLKHTRSAMMVINTLLLLLIGPLSIAILIIASIFVVKIYHKNTQPNRHIDLSVILSIASSSLNGLCILFPYARAIVRHFHPNHPWLSRPMAILAYIKSNILCLPQFYVDENQRTTKAYTKIPYVLLTILACAAYSASVAYTLEFNPSSQKCRKSPSLYADCAFPGYNRLLLMMNSVNAVVSLYAWAMYPLVPREYNGRDVSRSNRTRLPGRFQHLSLPT